MTCIIQDLDDAWSFQSTSFSYRFHNLDPFFRDSCVGVTDDRGLCTVQTTKRSTECKQTPQRRDVTKTQPPISFRRVAVAELSHDIQQKQSGSSRQAFCQGTLILGSSIVGPARLEPRKLHQQLQHELHPLSCTVVQLQRLEVAEAPPRIISSGDVEGLG